MKKSSEYRRAGTALRFLALVLAPWGLCAPALAGWGDEDCIHLDGSHYLSGAISNPAPDSAFTVEAWARYDSSTPDSQFIVSKNEDDGTTKKGYYIRLFKTSGNYYAEAGVCNGSPVATTFAIVAKEWNHYALVFDGSNFEFFVNGSSIGTSVTTETYSDHSLEVGRGERGGSTYPWTGYIDEVRYWSAARTQEEINDFMFAKLAGDETGLDHYYQFNSDINDLVSGGVNLVWSDGTAPPFSESGAFAGPRKALVLDGDGDYLSVPGTGLDFGTAGYTLLFWIKGDCPASDCAVIDHTDVSGGYRVEVTSEGRIRFSQSNQGGEDSHEFSRVVMDGSWHHVAVTRDEVLEEEASISLYVDGILDGTKTNFTKSADASRKDVTIGCYLDLSGNLEAALDDVLFFGYAFFFSEIQNTMFRNTDVDDGPTLYFRMDFIDPAGRLSDHSPDHSHTGTVHGNPSLEPSTAYNTWLGTESADWDNPGNWSRTDDPDAVTLDNVGILPFVVTEPDLNGIIDAYCNNILFSSAGLTLDTCDLHLKGNFIVIGAAWNPDTGSLVFDGTSTQHFFGSTSVYNLTLNNANGLVYSSPFSDVLTLTSGGEITLQSGDFDLLDNSVDVFFSGSTTGTLDESPGATVRNGNPNGSIVINSLGITDANPGNIAGLGLELSGIDPAPTVGSPLTLTIRRIHAVQTSLSGRTSILRCFEVEAGSEFTATVGFHYDESELNGIAEGKLCFAYSTDIPNYKTWISFDSTRDTGANCLTANGFTFPDGTVRVTLDNEDAPLLVDLAWFTATPALPLGVVVRWETLSELDNLGFYVRRAETADGPWERLNAVIIPARGNEVTGAAYEWVDDAVGPARTWWYRLEDVDSYGVSTLHPPVPVLIPSPAPDGPPRPPVQN